MTSPFYSSEQTELSRAVLEEVLAAVPDAVLIGGWGTWVRTGGPMGHDIDLILDRGQLAVLEGMVDDLSVSHHLAGTQWRATWRSIHLDLYVAHESRLGANLQLRTERLAAHQEHHDRYRVLTVPAHLATKLAALLDRPDSLPGRKDRAEILALLSDPATSATAGIIANASARTADQQRASSPRRSSSSPPIRVSTVAAVTGCGAPPVPGFEARRRRPGWRTDPTPPPPSAGEQWGLQLQATCEHF